MSDESFDRGGLPAVNSRQQLSLLNNSLVRRGLELVTPTSAGPLTTAWAELAAARRFWDLADGLLSGASSWNADTHRFLDLASRPLNDPTSWDVFGRRCRDAYRHALRALAIHLQIEFTDPVDCATRPEVLSLENPASLPRGILSHLPGEVNLIEHWVEMIESDRPQAQLLWEAPNEGIRIRWTGSSFSALKYLIEDTAELIEHGAVGVVFHPRDSEIINGTLVRWFKAIGEALDRDELLLEVSTQTKHMEILSPAFGRLGQIFQLEGETVPANAVVAVIYTH